MILNPDGTFKELLKNTSQRLGVVEISCFWLGLGGGHAFFFFFLIFLGDPVNCARVDNRFLNISDSQFPCLYGGRSKVPKR